MVEEKWKVQSHKKRIATVSRTIRIKSYVFDRVNEIAKKNDMSFNNVMNQIIEHGLENLKD